MRRRLPRGWWVGLLFVSPAVILFAIFGVYTVVYGFLLSFARWNGFSPHWKWTGFGNYVALLGGNLSVAPNVGRAAINTLIGMIIGPLAVAIIGLLLAVMLNSITRMRAALRTIYFIPYVTSGIAVFYAWRFIYEPDGALNLILRAVGLGALAQVNGFLGNTHTSLGSVIAVSVWSGVPMSMLLFLTGLQTIPESVIEAARVDGASGARLVWSVIVPLLNPITALVLILEFRGALQSYQMYLLMTNGGPVNSTMTLGLLSYSYAFGSPGDLGYASALGWMLGVLAIIIAVVNLRALRSRQ